MSQPKARRTSWVGWIISALLITASIWLWTERQNVVDAIQYHQYTPTPTIAALVRDAKFTDKGIFTLYATHPSIESSKAFNDHCQRREAKSPILGCYAANRIYVYDVTDERLDGLEVITAAHEMLHAVYDRLPEKEKQKINEQLEAEYVVGRDTRLDERMQYYAKTEPGQSINELHSIIGTEFQDINPELEKHYAKYFKDRKSLIALHSQVDGIFNSLSEESKSLKIRLEELAIKINQNTDKHNKEIAAYSQAVSEFNSRVENNGYRTQAEFQIDRQKLTARNTELSEERQTIQEDIKQYKLLYTKFESINAEAESLNQSIDSVLSDEPKI